MSFRKGPSGHLRRDPSEEAKIIKVNTSKRRSGQDECLLYCLTERRCCKLCSSKVENSEEKTRRISDWIVSRIYLFYDMLMVTAVIEISFKSFLQGIL